jgi:hypothetical protein
MEPDLQITLKGLPEDIGSAIGNAIATAVRTFKEVDSELDFRRMHRIVVTTNFAGELAELSAATASGNSITHTNEDYAVAIAKVMIIPRGDEFEIVPVINANFTAALAQEESDNFDRERFRSALHFLHHELCHVHDDNKKIDVFASDMLRTRYRGKDMYIRPLADVCWSEYIATLLSCSTAGENDINGMTESLADAVKRTKPLIDAEILSYRDHGDLLKLLEAFGRHGEFLAKAAAYTLGYIDGLGKPLDELSKEASEALSGSYFESTWNSMHTALGNMLKLYPDGWQDLSIMDELAGAIESYYADMGLILSTTDDGQAYLYVPFRPETTPSP